MYLRKADYVRYADDILIAVSSPLHATQTIDHLTAFLRNELKLSINPPQTSPVEEGVEFLGVVVSSKGITLSTKKRKEIEELIGKLRWEGERFPPEAIQSIKGYNAYYHSFCSADTLVRLDREIIKH